MNLTTRVGLLAGASALTLTSFSFADGSSESDVLKTRIAELEAKVASLETGDSWLTEQRTEEIRGIVQDVLADADTRASLLSTGLTAGYDQGFTIGDTGGGFLLRINGQIQTRWMLSTTKSGDTIEGEAIDTWRQGFEVTRAKLIFSGHVVDPSWKYRIELDFGITGFGAQRTFADTSDELDSSFLTQSTPLRDAYLMKQYDNGMAWMAGRMRVPLTREEMVDSIYQLAAERSLTNAIFTGGITNGFAAMWSNDFLKVMGVISNGANNLGRNALAPDVEAVAVTGRIDWLIAGNWTQFRQFTAPRGTEFGVLLGGAAHYQKGESGGSLGSEPETIIATGDVSLQGNGWNAFGAFNYKYVDPNIGDLDSSNVWGIVAQGGFYVTDELEPFLRYEYADLDNDTDNDKISILTFGLNYYVNANVKVTADAGYAFNGISPMVVPNVNGIAADGRSYGWRADPAGQDGQWASRIQLQLVF